MPVRSVNLKLTLARSERSLLVRQALWATHAAVNRAVSEIERVLLLCRGEGYCTSDEAFDAGHVRAEALQFARALQSVNGKPGVGTDDELLGLLRRWYVDLVPSFLLDENGNPGKGNAQNAGGFAGPMMDPASEGLQKIFDEILDPLPPWVAAMQEAGAQWQEASAAWLKTDVGKALQSPPHRPAPWVQRLRRGQAWQEAFLKDQIKKRKAVKGTPELVRQLKASGLLPMLQPPVTSQLLDCDSGLTPWDRLALRLAVGHLLSWESWNHRARANHARVQSRVDAQREVVEGFGGAVARIRQYEQLRHDELKQVAQASDDRPFRIGLRMTRAWDRVREAWSTCQDSEASRLEELARLQTSLRGRFGDPLLFRWLARDENTDLWRHADPVAEVARLNALTRRLERKRDHAVYTAPDPREHPRWLNYDAQGGSNLRKYRLAVEGGKVQLSLPLLVHAEGERPGSYCEQTFMVGLAPSGQLASPETVKDGDELKLRYRSAHQPFSAKPLAADILFSRRHLENRTPEAIEEGAIGPVWLKLVLDVDSKAPADWLDERQRVLAPRAMHHFNTGLAKRSRHADEVTPGLRVLAVDLGLRSLAACSVFELVEGRPETGLAFPADSSGKLFARHERSFLLRMPGESPSLEVRTARRAADDELGALRRDMGRLKGILRLSPLDNLAARSAALVELRDGLADEHSRSADSIIDWHQLDALDALADGPRWAVEVERVYREVERRLSDRIRDWRRATRSCVTSHEGGRARRSYAGGKSAWSIAYLESIRRLLQGWTLHGREYGQIRRADRSRAGVFAAGLLNHINALKRDRIKAGADLIVQAARGYLPCEKKGWQAQFDPCRLILFEDLARYRFRTDRSRRENRQLMQWSHRELLSEAKLQAEVYGMTVGTTGAGFTSRFHARTGAPGCRARLLTAEDMGSPYFAKLLESWAESHEVDFSKLVPGVYLPWEGGEQFVTLNHDGRPSLLHADVNAAQNLQRRFWTRHGDAYRVSVLEVGEGDSTVWYPDRDGSLLRGALGLLAGGDGYVRLKPAADGDGHTLERTTRAQWRRATGHEAAADDEQRGIDELEIELAAVLEGGELERRSGRKVFFRDPSGFVLRADRWYEAKIFWGRVTRRVLGALGLGQRPPLGRG